MAKDDYFVIVAQILSYLYMCLKNGERPNIDEISHDKLKINEFYWNQILINLYEDEFIKGIMMVKHLNCYTGVKIDITEFTITAKGIEYLHENNCVKRGLQVLAKSSEIAASIVAFLQLL